MRPETVAGASEVHALAEAIARATGLATTFDDLLDAVIAQLRQTLGVPPETTDDLVERELAEVRVRLALFRPRFDATCIELLGRHLPAGQLWALAAALETDALRAYFRAARAMHPELARASAALAGEMRDVALYEPATAATPVAASATEGDSDAA